MARLLYFFRFNFKTTLNIKSIASNIFLILILILIFSGNIINSLNFIDKVHDIRNNLMLLLSFLNAVFTHEY